MTLLAVKDYIANTVVPSVVIPSQVTMWTSVKGYRQMPKEITIGSKVAVVLGDIDDAEVRRTVPRLDPNNAGSKEITYTIPLYIYARRSDETAGGDDFDVLVWAIKTAFRFANTGFILTDPITSETSWLHAIGEKMRGRLLTPLQVAIIVEGQASQTHFEQQIRLEVKEWIQA